MTFFDKDKLSTYLASTPVTYRYRLVKQSSLKCLQHSLALGLGVNPWISLLTQAVHSAPVAGHVGQAKSLSLLLAQVLQTHFSPITGRRKYRLTIIIKSRINAVKIKFVKMLLNKVKQASMNTTKAKNLEKAMPELLETSVNNTTTAANNN